MPAHQAEALIATVAAEMQTVVTAEQPILECELPIDGSRFTAVIPPVVAAPAFAIRRRASRILTLADYTRSGILSAPSGGHSRSRDRGWPAVIAQDLTSSVQRHPGGRFHEG